MTPCPNDMSVWPEIHCQRGPHEHHSLRIPVDLRREHGYPDWAQVPDELAVMFTMMIWDSKQHPVDGGPYCPAHDAVSETLLSHHIWEPAETICVLSVLHSQPGTVVDMGAQVGWYSLLALAAGCEVEAWEADEANLALLEESAHLNGWTKHLSVIHERIGPDTPHAPAEPPIRLAKLDLEGAEADGVRVLWPAIAAGNVDHLLIELSPVFHDGYAELAREILAAGYEAYRFPDKTIPPQPLEHPVENDLISWAPEKLDPHQQDIWFRRIGASW